MELTVNRTARKSWNVPSPSQCGLNIWWFCRDNYVYKNQKLFVKEKNILCFWNIYLIGLIILNLLKFNRNFKFICCNLYSFIIRCKDHLLSATTTPVHFKYQADFQSARASYTVNIQTIYKANRNSRPNELSPILRKYMRHVYVYLL